MSANDGSAIPADDAFELCNLINILNIMLYDRMSFIIWLKVQKIFGGK